jgi:hypothetical protein
VFKGHVLRTSTERRLVTKIVTRMKHKLQDGSIKSNNLSLKIGYCNTTLSNYGIIIFVRFVSKIKIEVVE